MCLAMFTTLMFLGVGLFQIDFSKNETQIFNEFNELKDKYAKGEEQYGHCARYYNNNKDKLKVDDLSTLEETYLELKPIRASKNAYNKGVNLYEKNYYTEAINELSNVIEEDVEYYSKAKELIDTIKVKGIKDVITKADYLAKGYYYDEAIELVENIVDDYYDEDIVTKQVEKYKNQKSNLVQYEGEVSHVFFHSLIADTTKAFDGDAMEQGYNDWMTTVDEFNKMIEQMYDRGYILIDIHSLYNEVEDEEGNIYLEPASLMLPEGKKPFVLSVDDVNYYKYMEGDGFASKMVLDEDGNVACVFKTDDGKEIIDRDYDVVPLLDKFVEDNPDFSYKGAKGILALTGYEGVLGYRTDPKDDLPELEEEINNAKEVVERLKETGWQFASHSYGHRHMNDISYNLFKKDTKMWDEEVMSIVGPTDIYIYPYGEEVDFDDPKFQLLQDYGFKIFCGVWNKPFYRIYENSMRMTRRNLDGFILRGNPKAVEDLFDPYEVIDRSRPDFR